jgi:hypothetical protein
MQTRGNMAKADSLLNGMAAAGPAKERPKGKPARKCATIPCLNCGEPFLQKRSVNKFCGIVCANQLKHKQFRAELQAALDSGTLPTSKKEAQLIGSKFFLAKSCKKGHIGVRNAAGGTCVDCEREKHAKDNAEKKAAKSPLPAVWQSLQTSPVFLHILGDWRPLVVAL